MLNFITNLVQPIVKIRKEEWPKTILMFFYFFITITCLYILKPVRSAIFLEKAGFEKLPYVWFITIFVLIIVVNIYVRFSDRIKKNHLLIGTVGFFISNIVLFWWLLNNFNLWSLPAIFYIWVSIFSIMSVTQFWTLSNDIFNSREAKRLFGIIGSGGILGGMTGGFITRLMVTNVGTTNLLLIASGILFFSIILIQWVWVLENSNKDTKLHYAEEVEVKEEVASKVEEKEVHLKDIWKSKYLLMLLSVVFLAKLVSTLVEYQFNGIVQDAFVGIDEKTKFFGWFWGTLNMVSFAIQFFLTSKVLRHLGVKVSLLILPVGLLFGNFAILLNPVLWSSIFTMMCDGSLNYSLNQATKEVLYLPIPRNIRYKVKPFIDMVGYRSAKALGSLIILFVSAFLITDLKNLSYFTLALIGVWILIAVVMKKHYLRELRKQLLKEKGDISKVIVEPSEVRLLSSFINTFSKGSNKSQYTAIHALNLCRDEKINLILEEVNDEKIAVLKAKIEPYFKLPEQDVDDELICEELKVLFAHSNINDIEELVRFITSFHSKITQSDLKNFLSSHYPVIQKASFLLLLLNFNTFKCDDMSESLKLILKMNLAEAHPFIGESKGMDANGQGEEDDLKKKIKNRLREYLITDNSNNVFEMMEDILLDEEILLSEIEKLIKEDYLPLSSRKKLFKILGMIPKQPSVSILENTLLCVNGELKNINLEVLNKIRAENPELIFNEKLIQKEILLQVGEYQKILKFLSLYVWLSKSSNISNSKSDLFRKVQENRLNEIVQRMFLLLALLSEPEDIQIVYQGFSNKSEYVRANAIELLDNLLEPKVRGPVLSVLDGEDSLHRILEKGLRDYSWNETKAFGYLKVNAVSDNLWNSISSITIMGRFKLQSVLSECTLVDHFPNHFVRDIIHFTLNSIEHKN